MSGQEATTVFLIRHAAHDLVDRVLCGRMADVRLGPEGHCQAAAVAARLDREKVSAVYSSPLERAVETAARIGPAPGIRNALTELDVGAWTGRSFADLAADPAWRRWNVARSHARPPGGESMIEAQARAVQDIRALAADHPGGRIAIVSHGDIIRSILMAWLRMALDDWSRLEVSPASISALAVWPHDGSGDGKVLGINERVTA